MPAVVLIAAVRGVAGKMFDFLAVAYVIARVGQSLVHISPGAVLGGNGRFILLVVQLACLVGLLALAVWPL